MFKPVAGATILSRYRLVEQLARGRAGSVWLAEDAGLSRKVAAKIMDPQAADSPEALQRFKREAMAVARLGSSNAVQIFDYGVEDGCPIIVMERLQGEDLASLLARKGRIDPIQTARIVSGVARALTTAHEKGIIHRDLKPANIFLAKAHEELIPKVLDFGVAKLTSGSSAASGTAVGNLLCSAHYASPELARGSREIDFRTDVWSLGAIIYYALTGRVPFDGANDGDIIVNICTKPHLPPTQIAPDLPPDVDRFVDRALAKAPDDRFKSARELSQAFKRLAGHYSTTSAPTLDASRRPPPLPPVAVAPSAYGDQDNASNAATALAPEAVCGPDADSGIVRSAASEGAPASGVVPAELTDSLGAPSGVISPSLLDSLASPSQAWTPPPEAFGAGSPEATAGTTEFNAAPTDRALAERPRRRGVIAGVALALTLLVGGAAIWSQTAGPAETTAPSESTGTAGQAADQATDGADADAEGTASATASATGPTSSAAPPSASTTASAAASADETMDTRKPRAKSKRPSRAKPAPATTTGASQGSQPASPPDDSSWMDSRF